MRRLLHVLARHPARRQSVPAATTSSQRTTAAVLAPHRPNHHRRSDSSSRDASSAPSPHPAAATSPGGKAGSGQQHEREEARASSSVMLLSATNEVLLLRRAETSSAFASAFVFPGGNLDPFHDGPVPAPGSPERHTDGPAYRMGAIRETFEETGILLAVRDGALVHLSPGERDEARTRIHGNKVRFADFLTSIDAVADTANLIPFTRWITPPRAAKRFTTQMYIYMLPISKDISVPSETVVPTSDGGVEHTTAQFAPAQDFLARAADGSIVLFPPQVYLLELLGRFLARPGGADREAWPAHHAERRGELMSFLQRGVTAETEAGRRHATAGISWADKVMSPYVVRTGQPDGRVVMALDKPGPELEGVSDRGGDWERVVLVRFGQGPGGVPSNVEIRTRDEVLAEGTTKARL